MIATTRFETAQASRYLQTLCKHFGHKIPVQFTPSEGEITFPFGTCALRADTEGLSIETRAADRADLDRLNTVIRSHLERFAFRETPVLRWQTHPRPIAPTERTTT